MRQAQEMAVEFANALNAAAAAESECAKLRRLLEEERVLMQRLKQEKEDEAQMAQRKIERMSQRLADAQKDVEYATARADVAENEWVKLKRELREAQEKEDEAQMAQRKIERMSQRLAEAQKDVDYATARADVAENEWVKLKRELREAQGLVQLLNPESDEKRQIVLRRGDDNESELANARNAASINESECVKLRTLLEEERKLVQRLILEKDDEAQLAKRQIEEISQELADARKDAEYATTRADLAETEWIKAKKELQEEKELSQLLKPECDELRQSAMRQVEEKERELINVLHASEIAKRECAKLKRMLEEEQQLVQRLIREKDDEVQLAKRQIEEMYQGLAHARKDAELARKDADAAENEWTKVKRDLKNMEEHVKLLKLQCQEIRESASRQDEQKELQLTNALNASAIAEGECANFKRMLIEEAKTVQRLIIEKDDEAEQAKRQIEKLGRELASARKEAQYARTDADIAENEWTKVKRELKEKEEVIKHLKLEVQEMSQITMIQVEEMIGQGLEDARNEAELARNDADIAQSEWIKAKKDLQEKVELIQLLKLECQETRERAIREVEEKELELADALNAVTSASSSSSVAQECVICLTNERDMAFGCGHMTCEECGMSLWTCPICREDITSRIKLFPG